MPTYQRNIVLLPAPGLRDLSTDWEEERIEGLLTAWSAAWHPGLLAQTGQLPGWASAEAPNEQLSGLLVLGDAATCDLLPPDWEQELTQAGGRLLRVPPVGSSSTWLSDPWLPFAATAADWSTWPQTVPAALLAARESGEPASENPLAQGLVAGFYSLGLNYLLTELLTRRMRYLSNVDLVRLERHTIAAAKACLAGELGLAREQLCGAFESLAQAKDQFYPATAYLLDLLLLAPSTLGGSFQQALQSRQPVTVLASGEVIAQLAARNPAALEQLRARLLDRQWVLCGGEDVELENSLLDLPSLIDRLMAGRKLYLQHLGQPCEFYGRRRFGLTPALPAILARLGFQGAFHNSLDDGHFPLATQCCSHWQGCGPGSLPALFRPPQDAGLAGTILCFGENMGQTMDLDHVATLGFAHWPQATSEWFCLFKHSAEFLSPQGTWVHLERYFRETQSPGNLGDFGPDKYRGPFLEQAVEQGVANVLSVWRDRQTCATQLELANTLHVLAEQVQGATLDRTALDAGYAKFQAELTRRPLTNTPAAHPPASPPTIDAQPALEHAATLLCDTLTRQSRASETIGELRLNPTALAQGSTPGLGYQWQPSSQLLPVRTLAAGNRFVLQNDQLVVTVSGEQGGVRGIEQPGKRGNHFSQHLALRNPAWGTGEAAYLPGTVEKIEPRHNANGSAEMIATGKFVHPQQGKLGTFQQITRLAPGHKWAELEFAWDSLAPLKGSPWQHYLASRVAWADGAATILRNVHSSLHATSLSQLEATQCLELEGVGQINAILTGGASFHCQREPRKLDTLLAVAGETAQTGWKQALCVEVANGIIAAQQWLARSLTLAAPAPPLASSWLFHLDQPTVVPCRWETISLATASKREAFSEADGVNPAAWSTPPEEIQRPWQVPGIDSDGAAATASPPGSPVLGVRVLLNNAREQAVRGMLRTFRPVKWARALNLIGQVDQDLEFNSQGVHIDLLGHEWLWLEIWW